MKIEDGNAQNDPLDGVLTSARWPEPSAQSTQRLQEFWKKQWDQRRLRVNWLWPLAAAATIAIGIGSLIVLVLNPPRMLPRITVSVNPGRSLVVEPPPRVPVMESRPPTMRERLLIGDMGPSKNGPGTTPASIPQPPPLDARTLASLALEEKEPQRQRQIIAQLIQSDDPAAVGLYLQLVVDRKRRNLALDALADVKEPPVQGLIDQLSNPRVAIRFAAARALGRIDGPVTTEQLVALVKRNTQRREALAALLYSDGPDASAFLANARGVPALASTLRAVEIQLKTAQ